MDHQDISEHLVTVAMNNGDDVIIERAPINPIVYLEPPLLWLSGPLGTWLTINMVRIFNGCTVKNYNDHYHNFRN